MLSRALPNNEFHGFKLTAAQQKDRLGEVARKYRKLFDIPYRNDDGAKNSIVGYPCPMLEGCEFWPMRWVNKTITEQQLVELYELYENEMRGISRRDNCEQLRGAIVERLWIKFYGKNAEAERERIAANEKDAEEAKWRKIEREERREKKMKASILKGMERDFARCNQPESSSEEGEVDIETPVNPIKRARPESPSAPCRHVKQRTVIPQEESFDEDEPPEADDHVVHASLAQRAIGIIPE